jgi:hypothetical protein
LSNRRIKALQAMHFIIPANNPTVSYPNISILHTTHTTMFFTRSSILFTASASLVLLATIASAGILLASNPVDACNGSNNYGVGHSCAYSTSQGTAEGSKSHYLSYGLYKNPHTIVSLPG